jgi:hypothetical protein
MLPVAPAMKFSRVGTGHFEGQRPFQRLAIREKGYDDEHGLVYDRFKRIFSHTGLVNRDSKGAPDAL